MVKMEFIYLGYPYFRKPPYWNFIASLMDMNDLSPLFNHHEDVSDQCWSNKEKLGLYELR